VVARFWEIAVVDAYPVAVLGTLGELMNTDFSEQNITWFVGLLGTVETATASPIDT
jgi:hypothetical protein